MFVLAAFNPETNFFRAKSESDGLSTHHLILCRRNPNFGIRFGFKSPYSIKTSTRQRKTCRQHVVQATHLVAGEEEHGSDGAGINRRFAVLLGLPMLATMMGGCERAWAVKQLQIAGRVPGLSLPDENGMRIYRRPDAKSGGHGVGWSPIIPYTFMVPPDWEEVPVSIADLGGTEIDLRFANKKEGNACVVVAPVLRFADDDDNVKIEDIGTPEKVIYAFGPELIGQNVEGKLKSAEVKEHSGRTYYQYELEAPHALINATAAGNRMYLMTVSANGDGNGSTFAHQNCDEPSVIKGTCGNCLIKYTLTYTFQEEK